MTRDMQFQGSLPAGSWEGVKSESLEGVPPAELGFVRLHEVSHQGINLRRKSSISTSAIRFVLVSHLPACSR